MGTVTVVRVRGRAVTLSTTYGCTVSGQHFIRSDVVADELVRAAGVCSTDHVLEIGAGTGRLTRPLVGRAARVTAVELDGVLAERLERAFAGRPTVRIVHGDILNVQMPEGSWCVFGNVPFALTTSILRHLLDNPVDGPERADLLLQFEAARKRASPDRSTLLSLGWLPWWSSCHASHPPARVRTTTFGRRRHAHGHPPQIAIARPRRS